MLDYENKVAIEVHGVASKLEILTFFEMMFRYYGLSLVNLRFCDHHVTELLENALILHIIDIKPSLQYFFVLKGAFSFTTNLNYTQLLAGFIFATSKVPPLLGLKLTKYCKSIGSTSEMFLQYGIDDGSCMISTELMSSTAPSNHSS